MHIFEKKAKYFKFFEDSKIVEIDQQNKRIAIIFFGKENIIHIFDLTPYIDYLPIQEIPDDPKEDQEYNCGEKKHNEDLNEIFNKLNLKNLNTTTEEYGKTILTDNQEFIKFNNFNLNLVDDKEKTFNNISHSNIIQLDAQSHAINYNNNINLNIKSEFTAKKIKFSLHKPKIKTKLLSVIVCPSNIIIGIKWLNINQPQPSNGQEKIQNKQLLAVFDDGNVHVYSLKSQNYDIKTKINLTKLQYIPFETFPEQWKISGQVYTGKPIRDFYITAKSNRLYTLHTDNYIIMWIIAYIGNKLSIIASYAINITPELPVNKFLVDSKDKIIFSFHNQCFKIFKIMEKPPFPLLYTKEYDEINVKEIEIIINNDGYVSNNYSNRDNMGNPNSNGIDKNNISRNNNITTYNITPIKKSYDNFIDDDESYAIYYKDIIDLSEDLKIYDINFFFNVHKPEFSLFEEFVIIPVYLIKYKKYVLMKFLMKEFMDKISDFSYFEKSVKGEANDVLKILKVSYSPIIFSLSPFFYYKIDKDNLQNDEEDVLDIVRNSIDILNAIYQPIVFIDESILNFVNLKRNELIFQYELFNKKIVNPEYLDLKWTINNTILMSSTKVLMNVIKYCNEDDILGIPISPNKIDELMKS